jgi:hypothetical protein
MPTWWTAPRADPCCEVNGFPAWSDPVEQCDLGGGLPRAGWRPAVKITEVEPLPDLLAVVVVPPVLPVVGPVVVLPDVEGVVESDVVGVSVGDGEDEVDGEDELGGGEVVGGGVVVGVAIGTSGVGVEVSGGNGLDTFCVLVAGVLHFDPLGEVVLVLALAGD